MDMNGIKKIHLLDAKPIGINVRSTIATYCGVFDDLRKLFGELSDEYNTKDFSYNTGKLRCPTCNGTGSINMDVQFLPDMEISCPDCDGLRYCEEAEKIRYNNLSIKDYMDLTVDEAILSLNTDSKLERRFQVEKPRDSSFPPNLESLRRMFFSYSTSLQSVFILLM